MRVSEESKEKRIYVVVAETVQVPSDSVWMERETVSQPPGRIAAQVGHVVSKMRVVRAVRNKELYISRSRRLCLQPGIRRNWIT